jgi:hypothetical protein
MQIEIREDIGHPAWTSRSLKAVKLDQCPGETVTRCVYRHWEIRPLRKLCRLLGCGCNVKLAGEIR